MQHCRQYSNTDAMQLADDKKQKIYDKALGSIKHWLERFDTIIIGPGLGRDEMVHHVVMEVSMGITNIVEDTTADPVSPLSFSHLDNF